MSVKSEVENVCYARLNNLISLRTENILYLLSPNRFSPLISPVKEGSSVASCLKCRPQMFSSHLEEKSWRNHRGSHLMWEKSSKLSSNWFYSTQVGEHGQEKSCPVQHETEEWTPYNGDLHMQGIKVGLTISHYHIQNITWSRIPSCPLDCRSL